MEFESGVSLGSLETARFCRSICPRWSLTFLLVKCYGYLLAQPEGSHVQYELATPDFALHESCS